MIGNDIDKKSIKALAQLIEQCNNVVITCHVKPDGDAVGSTLALFHILSTLGKAAHIITPDSPPRSLSIGYFRSKSPQSTYRPPPLSGTICRYHDITTYRVIYMRTSFQSNMCAWPQTAYRQKNGQMSHGRYND